MPQLNAQNPVNNFTSVTYIGGYHIKCNGQSTGTIKANPSFGTPPHTFLWSSGETSAQINNKPAGVYTVTMTDSLNVTHVDTFELRQPYTLNYQSTLSDFYGFNISSANGNDGTIQLNATGGTPPYRYLWNNGDSLANRRDLTAGTYSFTITDANQCSTTGSYTLTAPNPIQISFTNVEPLSCFKSDDGKATLNISGGLGNYSVVWGNGSFSLSPDDLTAGYNEVRIYEQGTAIIDTGITLTQPDEIDIQFTYSDYNGYNVSCVDCFNGTVASTITGGTTPYTYQWDDPNNSSTANLSSLNGGDYTLMVIDVNGCKGRNTATLRMPSPKDWSRYGNSNIDTSEFIGSTDTSAVLFKTNSQEALRLMGNGNVGVGVANPTEKFEVNGTIKAQGLKIDNFEIRYDAATATTPEAIIWGRGEILPGPVAPVFPTTCIDPLNIERVNIYNGGAVYKVKTLLQNSMICKNNDPTMYVGLYGCDGAIEVNINENSNGSQSFVDNNKLLINTLCGKDVVVGKSDAGNLIANYRIGIGTSNPTERLQVEGNSILNGNVRIGNANSTAANYSHKLVVEGIVYSREFRVTDIPIWPDFVFAKSHQLISLPELKLFIEKESHLPGIPSAQEVNESGGFSINEMILKLLQKQEETTLYLLQLNEKIAYLEKENKLLKANVK